MSIEATYAKQSPIDSESGCVGTQCTANDSASSWRVSGDLESRLAKPGGLRLSHVAYSTVSKRTRTSFDHHMSSKRRDLPQRDASRYCIITTARLLSSVCDLSMCVVILFLNAIRGAFCGNAIVVGSSMSRVSTLRLEN